MIEQIILKCTDNYFLAPSDTGAYLFIYQPYTPFNRKEGHAYIDSFYLASNSIYQLQKKLITELSNYNPVIIDEDIKSKFVDNKIGFRLRNTLIGIPKYGSRVAIGMIEVGYKLDKIELPVLPPYICESCRQCIEKCPNNALDNGFVRSNCLRDAQASLNANNIDISALDGSLIGCDFCQRSCPHNTKTTIDMPEVLANELNFNNLFKNLAKGKSALVELGNLIGHNYIRPTRLLFFALCAINEARYAHFAKEYINHPNETIAKKAKEIVAQFDI